MIKILFSAFILQLWQTNALANPSVQPMQLLFEGADACMTIADTSRIDTGLNWYGIFKTDSNFSLKKVTLIFTEEKYDGACAGWVNISTNQTRESVFLVGLRDTLVKDVIVGESYEKFVYPGVHSVLHIPSSNRYYTLMAFGCVKGSSERDISFEDYKLRLTDSNANITQELITSIACMEVCPTLLWWGDLDGDGKIDMVIRDCGEMWGFCASLYLSSAADSSALVKKVSSKERCGCD